MIDCCGLPVLIMMTKGDQLRHLRLSLGFSQQKMADILCVQKLCVSRWESGHRNIPPPTFKLINILSKYNLWEIE